MGITALANGARTLGFGDESRRKYNGDRSTWGNCTAEEPLLKERLTR
jgi:hypothetical protein